ncbi:MAG: hypothetical protein Q9194_005609, partial [Teloschistes cf. exilis]
MDLLLLVALLPLSWISYSIYCLLHNYREASHLGIPIICVPISPDNQLWIALQTAFPSLYKRLPFNAFAPTRHCRLGWEFRDRYKTHERLGDAWVAVTPWRNWIYIAQAEAAAEIYARNRDFAQGADWQRQRKLTATPFNEQKSPLVWSEALRQANDMLHSWLSHGPGGTTATSEDVRTLALDVLAFAGFQKSYPWQSQQAMKERTASTYRDSLAIILQNVLIILVLPARLFSMPFVPKQWQQVGWALRTFKKYMLDQIDDEKRSISEGEAGSKTLVSNLVRAVENQQSTVAGSGLQAPKPLSVDEILGNIFVFNFAGHDTTAITFATAIYSLVAYPEVQDWISEEINFYLPDDDSSTWQYEKTFPKLQRCLAVLLETVRLYNPLLNVPKYTAAHPQTLRVNDRTLRIPPDTIVAPHMNALHTHPRYWGDDSLQWRPSRWIISSTPSFSNPPSSSTTPNNPNHSTPTPNLAQTLPTERLLAPRKGTYIPWSDGVQNCPGKKFAQV